MWAGATQMILNNLPPEHPLRNTPFGELAVEYRWHKASDSAPWRQQVKDAPKLTGFTFNQLGPAWTTWDIWRVKNAVIATCSID